MLSEVSLDTLHSTYIPLISITGFIDYWTILRNLPVKQLTNYDRKFQSFFKGVERQSDYTNKNKCQIPIFAFIFNFFCVWGKAKLTKIYVHFGICKTEYHSLYRIVVILKHSDLYQKYSMELARKWNLPLQW